MGLQISKDFGSAKSHILLKKNLEDGKPERDQKTGDAASIIKISARNTPTKSKKNWGNSRLNPLDLLD